MDVRGCVWSGGHPGRGTEPLHAVRRLDYDGAVAKERAGARSAETFGPFEIYERLGTGGMAVVHRAIRTLDGGGTQEVALKRLLPHLAEDAAFIRAFAREAKMAQRLRHPNICQIHELGRVGDHYFISMEYLDGCDLRTLLRRSYTRGTPAPIPMALSVIAQLCAALDHAHAAIDEETGEPLGLVHRDVSPANVLVTRGGHVKVIDFGIAKATLAKFRTETGRFRGKLGYLSPEAIQGHLLDGRSDIFSMGVIAHELLTGRPLFGAMSDFDTLSKVQFGQVDPPSRLSVHCPIELDAIIMTALAKDAALRWQTASAMRNALLEVAGLAGGMASDEDLGAWVTSVAGERTDGRRGVALEVGATEQVVDLVWGSDVEMVMAGEAVDVPDVSVPPAPPRRSTDKVIPLEMPPPEEPVAQKTEAMWKLQPRGKRGNRESSSPPASRARPAPPAVPKPAAFAVPPPVAAAPARDEGDHDPRFDTAELEKLTPGDDGVDHGDTVQMESLSREEIMEVGSGAARVDDGGHDTAKMHHLRRDPSEFETVQIDRLEQVSAASETIKAPALVRPAAAVAPVTPPSPAVASTDVVPRVGRAGAPSPTAWLRRWDAWQTAVAALLLLLAPAPRQARGTPTGTSASPRDATVSARSAAPAVDRDTTPVRPTGLRPATSAAPAAPPGHLLVVSAPRGGTVWLDDKVIGRTPLDLHLPCKDGLLAVEREGFKTAIRTLSFDDGRREARIEVDLDRKPKKTR